MTSLTSYHERIRHRGVNLPVYWAARAVLQPLIHVYFRLRRLGREHIPGSGPVILASNHRSFLDPFVIGCSSRRPIYFVAKQQLFENRLVGWLLNCLGAFPIRRGESDEQAMATARELLGRGEAVVIFPEGTRVRHGALGQPKRGVGRLALETGAPVVPIAMVGSERARRGWVIRPCRVRLRCGRPLTFPRVDEPSPRLAAEVAERIWPCVQLQWEWLGGLPAIRTAAVVGAGSMGTAVAALLARAGLEVQLGCRTPAKVDALSSEPDPAVDGAARTALAASGVKLSTVGQIEFAGADLVVFAVPSRGLPAAVAQVGAQIGERSAVLVLTKGLVGPLGTLPTQYVDDRVRARAVAALGGPTHADEAVATGAAVVLATEDDALRGQLVEVLERARLNVAPTRDVNGTQLAGCAKNAAALAAAAGSVRSMNAAGAAAGAVFGEVYRYAVELRGADPLTFVGLAGTGDLVGTALAQGSRNRRAGELLGSGVPTDQVRALVGAAAEALDTVPLLAAALASRGVDAPALQRLTGLVEGGVPAEGWLEEIGGRADTAAARAA